MSGLPLAIVTGSSEGIGRGISIKLAQNGFIPVLAARNREKLEETSDLISKENNQAIIIPTDITKEEEVLRLFRKAEKFGEIRVLVNNAGIATFSAVEDITLEEWQQMLDVNLTGAFLCSRAAIQRMKKKRIGHIIFINSFSGIRPLSFGGGYSASKYGLKGFADTLRLELRKFNIKVTSVFPGAVNSSFWDKFNYTFSRDEMVTIENVVDVVWSVISQKERSVLEEIYIRQVGGDF